MGRKLTCTEKPDDGAVQLILHPLVIGAVEIVTAPLAPGIELPNVPAVIELTMVAVSVSGAACAVPTCWVASATDNATATAPVALAWRAR